MNKIFGAKKITNLIYGLMILLPMFSILGRVIYTQSNPNAIDSYSMKKDLNYQLTDNTQLIDVNEIYYFTTDVSMLNSTICSYIPFSSINFISGLPSNLPTDVYRFRLYYNANNLSYSLQWEGTTTIYQVVANGSSITTNVSFTFIPSSNVLLTQSYYGNSIKQIVFGSQNQLDNAFDYSLSTFIDDNNFGNVDLFSWFTDLFLDPTYSRNALYVNFVNWYLNYTLLISSGYLLFLVLIWFTQYVRKIMDKSMYHDFGGF